jgi:hypothetical protein
MNEILEILDKKLDNVTGELMKMRSSVKVIEENMEIVVKNELGIDTKVKTNELIKEVYEHIRPGGQIDAKFEKCKSDHTTLNILGKFNKNANVYLSTIKIIVYIFIVAAVGYGLYEGNKREKKEAEISSKLQQLETLVK